MLPSMETVTLSLLRTIFKMNTAGQIQLMKIQADNVTLNDVNLVATAANKHTLDVWGSQNVQLNNVTLNHENAQSGAPLVVNGSDVTVSGNFSVVTGDNSWYGVNLDNKNGNASLTFAEDATLTFTDNSSTADKIFVVPEAPIRTMTLLLWKITPRIFSWIPMKTETW